ncbi:hypothetical protein [Kiloniella sp. b19]|uniref:hypothetical protein n=1 Tax=Kiloniella sp. GXU_MW_B19 TaxID=3141326 RepID=UPI0031DC1A7E
MTPHFQITANGRSITSAINEHLISLSITDKRGFEADDLSITFADPEQRFALPTTGAALRCSIGLSPSQLVNKGSFTVDDVNLDGPPDVITITARSVDFAKAMKEGRDQSFSGKTIGEIFESLADKSGLTPRIADDLRDIVIDHLDQTNESAANLITRLGQSYDAIAQIKDGHLLFMPRAKGRTVSGQSLPGLAIAYTGIERFRYTNAARQTDYTGVEAIWHNQATAETLRERAGTKGNIKTLRETYPTREEALAAAQSAFRDLKRKEKSMSVTLSPGNPIALPDQPVFLSGFRNELNRIKWISGDITHTLTTGGLKTEIQLEEIFI